MRGALLAMVEAFLPNYSYAAPSDLKIDRATFFYDTAPREAIIPIAWMTYLDAPTAKLITPPASIINETTPDGGLFMAATDESFEAANPAHRAGEAIHAIVDPLNFIVPFKVTAETLSLFGPM